MDARMKQKDGSWAGRQYTYRLCCWFLSRPKCIRWSFARHTDSVPFTDVFPGVVVRIQGCNMNQLLRGSSLAINESCSAVFKQRFPSRFEAERLSSPKGIHRANQYIECRFRLTTTTWSTAAWREFETRNPYCLFGPEHTRSYSGCLRLLRYAVFA